jgi:hypothetical protein
MSFIQETFIKDVKGQAPWFTLVISAIQEVKIKRTSVPGQPGQNVRETHLNNLARHSDIHLSVIQAMWEV